MVSAIPSYRVCARKVSSFRSTSRVGRMYTRGRRGGCIRRENRRQYHRPIARPGLFCPNRDSWFNEEIQMKLSQAHRTALIVTMMLILQSGLDTKGFGQANSPQGVKNIVMVHGAWADGSCWSKVIALLQAKGFHVVAVQNPLTSLADDVAATKRIIALQDGPVILVGHSYAGV